MKIEKINDRQIRCVLSKEDLEDRKIRLSELVCGGEKARGLLRDMMMQASRELGFSFNNNPLMIEAMPTGKDQLVLIITRVDDPGEIDSRFRNFSGKAFSGAAASGEKDAPAAASPAHSRADDILNLLKQFKKQLDEMRAQESSKEEGGPAEGMTSSAGSLASEEDGEAGSAAGKKAQSIGTGAVRNDGLAGAGTGSVKGAGKDAGAGAGPVKDGGKGIGAGAEPVKDGGKGVKAGVEPVKDGGKGADAGTGPVKNGRKGVSGKNQGRELEEEIYQYTRFYLFKRLSNVLDASRRVPEDYQGDNSLYKNPDDGAFYLLVKKMDTDPEQFNRICNVLSEYSVPMDYSSGMDEFFREHMQVIVAERAMQQLRSV